MPKPILKILSEIKKAPNECKAPIYLTVNHASRSDYIITEFLLSSIKKIAECIKGEKEKARMPVLWLYRPDLKGNDVKSALKSNNYFFLDIDCTHEDNPAPNKVILTDIQWANIYDFLSEFDEVVFLSPTTNGGLKALFEAPNAYHARIINYLKSKIQYGDKIIDTSFGALHQTYVHPCFVEAISGKGKSILAELPEEIEITTSTPKAPKTPIPMTVSAPTTTSAPNVGAGIPDIRELRLWAETEDVDLNVVWHTTQLQNGTEESHCMVKCPYHNDTNPSAKITVINKKAFFTCFSNKCQITNKEIEMLLKKDLPKLYAQRIKNRYQLIKIEGMLYIKNDSIIERPNLASEIDLVGGTLPEFRDRTEQFIYKVERACLALAEEYEHPIPKGIYFANGLYDEEIDAFRPYGQTDIYFRHWVLNANYSPDAKNSALYDIMCDIAGEDATNDILAFCVPIVAPEQAWIVVYGSGGNGKGVFTRIIASLFRSIAQVEDLSDTNRFFAYQLLDKRLYLYDEPSVKNTSMEALKRYTNFWIEAEKKYESEKIKFLNTGRWIITCNQLPKMTETDAVKRRFRLFHFQKRYQSQFNFDSKLEALIKNKEAVDYIAYKALLAYIDRRQKNKVWLAGSPRIELSHLSTEWPSLAQWISDNVAETANRYEAVSANMIADAYCNQTGATLPKNALGNYNKSVYTTIYGVLGAKPHKMRLGTTGTPVWIPIHENCDKEDYSSLVFYKFRTSF